MMIECRHGACNCCEQLVEVRKELAEARQKANEYYFDIRQHVDDYQWEKHWQGDREECPWLADPDLRTRTAAG